MIQFDHVSKHYDKGASALLDIDLTIADGELVFLSGPSGAGKSTLLQLITGLVRPSAGTVLVNGQDVARLSTTALAYLRRNLGVISQSQSLLRDRTVLANVMLPLVASGAAKSEGESRARAALDKLGLLEKARAFPSTLSGGEQQRVAIARAIVNRPQIILADEPTANLDAEAAATVLDALKSFHRAGATCVIATHDEHAMAHSRIIGLRQGRLINEGLAA